MVYMQKRKQISAELNISFGHGYHLSNYLQNQMWHQVDAQIGYRIAIGTGYYEGRNLENIMRRALLKYG